MQPFEKDRRVFQEREKVEQLENCKALIRKKQYNIFKIVAEVSQSYSK